MITTVAGIEIDLHPYYVDLISCFIDGDQTDEMRSFVKETTKLRRLLDVGALTGVFSFVFARDSGTTAYAFEPSPHAFPWLVHNCARNPDRPVIPMRLFIGSDPGRRVSGFYSGLQSVAGDGDLQFLETRIDDLGIELPDCMKIDVEGYEGAVLRGARRTILESRPLIFLEVHPPVLHQGETVESLRELLYGWGYSVFDHEGAPVEVFDASVPVQRVICRP